MGGGGVGSHEGEREPEGEGEEEGEFSFPADAVSLAVVGCRCAWLVLTPFWRRGRRQCICVQGREGAAVRRHGC